MRTRTSSSAGAPGGAVSARVKRPGSSRMTVFIPASTVSRVLCAGFSRRYEIYSRPTASCQGTRRGAKWAGDNACPTLNSDPLPVAQPMIVGREATPHGRGQVAMPLAFGRVQAATLLYRRGGILHVIHGHQPGNRGAQNFTAEHMPQRQARAVVILGLRRRIRNAERGEQRPTGE